MSGRRILIVAPAPPVPPRSGFHIRVFHLARGLARNHAVSLLCYSDGADDWLPAATEIFARVFVLRPPRPVGGSKRLAQLVSIASPRSHQMRSLHSPTLQTAVDMLAGEQHFDVVQIESPQMGGFVAPAACATVLDEHNIEFELLQRMSKVESTALRRTFNRLEHLKLRAAERRCWSRVDGCVVTSDREEAIVRAATSTPTCVVPNGVDLEYFRPDADAAVDPANLVFTGAMNYRPNTDAAIHFITEILPLIHRRRPEVTATVCGRGAPRELLALDGGPVTVTGPVEDVRPYVARAATVVVPIRMGSGTRLKVLEALAMGKAAVSTSLGCEGIDVVDGEHLVVADGAQAFADSVDRLLSDRALAASLGRRGRLLAERLYGWERAAEILDEFHGRVVRERESRPRVA